MQDEQEKKENNNAEDEHVHNDEEKEIPMRPDEPLAEAGRTELLKHLKKLHKNEDKAREGEDPEGVHDMRVATRRLRAGLKVLEETVYESDKAGKIRRKLRALANALGETRDSDVFLEHLERYMAGLPGEKLAGIEPLREAILERREAGRKHMLKVLDKKQTSRTLDKLEKFLKTPGAGVLPPPEDSNEAAPTLVRHFSGSAILRRYEAVRAYETRFPASPEVLHRLRVACKRLRYTLEFFEEALLGEAKSLIEQLVEVQDHLGAMHDQQVALELIGKLEKKHPDNQALLDYASVRMAENDKLNHEFESLWQRLNSPEYRRSLASVLTGD